MSLLSMMKTKKQQNVRKFKLVWDKKFEGYSEFKTNQGAAKKKKAMENKAAKQLEEEYILNL